MGQVSNPINTNEVYVQFATGFQAAVQAALTNSANAGKTVVLLSPPSGNVSFSTPVAVTSSGAPFATCNFRYHGNPASLLYTGPGAAFSFSGFKNGSIEITGLRLNGNHDNQVGILIGADSFSCSAIKVGGFVDVTPSSTGVGLIGLQIGSDSSNDVNGVDVKNFTFTGQSGTMASIHALGYTAIQLIGGNTLNCSFYDCTANYVDIAFSTDKSGHTSGGSGSTFIQCGTSGCNLSYHINGSFGCQIYGGRLENGASALLQGDPLTSGRGTGRLTMQGTIIEGFDASGNHALGYVNDGTIIGIYSNGLVDIDAVNGATGNTYTLWVETSSNQVPGPTLSVTRSPLYGSDLVTYSDALSKPRIVQTSTSFVDGHGAVTYEPSLFFTVDNNNLVAVGCPMGIATRSAEFNYSTTASADNSGNQNKVSLTALSGGNINVQTGYGLIFPATGNHPLAYRRVQQVIASLVTFNGGLPTNALDVRSGDTVYVVNYDNGMVWGANVGIGTTHDGTNSQFGVMVESDYQSQIGPTVRTMEMHVGRFTLNDGTGEVRLITMQVNRSTGEYLGAVILIPTQPLYFKDQSGNVRLDVRPNGSVLVNDPAGDDTTTLGAVAKGTGIPAARFKDAASGTQSANILEVYAGGASPALVWGIDAKGREVTPPASASGNGVLQSGATALSAPLTLLTASLGQTAFVLPTGVAGMKMEAINTGATTALVYCPSGGTMNGSSNASASVTTLTSAVTIFYCSAAGAWYSK